MAGTFKPQETSMNSFKATEEKLYKHFLERGYGEAVSKAIAYNFSQFMMGYITAEGAAQFLVNAGADVELARDIVELFRDAKDGARSHRHHPSKSYASAGF